MGAIDMTTNHAASAPLAKPVGNALPICWENDLVSRRHRFGRTALVFSGALPLLLASHLYDVGALSYGNYGGWRTWGLLGVLAVLLGALATVAAALAVWLGLDRASPEFRRWLRAAFCLSVAINAATVGAEVFESAGDDGLLYGLSGLFLLALGLAYRRHTEADRALMARTFCRLGLAALLLPGLAMPGVAWAYADFGARGSLSPQIPAAWAALPDAPERIILLTFDALRYRSTSFAAPERGSTPAWRALADEGTWFSNCHSASDRTILSIPSILTGIRSHDLYSAVDNRGGYLRAGLLRGLGGLLAPAGYQAFYATNLIAPGHMGLASEFVAGGVINSAFGSVEDKESDFLPLQAAAEWASMIPGNPRAEPEARMHPVVATRRTFDRALAILKGAPTPAFIWVHVGAPHAPYFEVPAGDAGKELHPERYARVREGDVLSADGRALASHERVYESYARFADAELARFVTQLKAEGLWEASLVVATSDHGESFSPEARLHGAGVLSEDLTHVPLVFREPGRRGTARVDRQVSHEDIVPTVLTRVYGQAPAALTGHDLFDAGAGPARTTYTWAALDQATGPGHGAPGTVAAYQGRFKFTSSPHHRRERLYDLLADPGERHDLSRSRPAVLAALRARARRDLGM